MENEVRNFTITAMENSSEGGFALKQVEEEWLPYLGPTTLVLARKIDGILATENKYAINVPKWADAMGVSPNELLTACHRLVRYALATWGDRDPTLFVVRKWPNVAAAMKTPAHKAALIALPDIA